jgi:hypothetical protein
MAAVAHPTRIDRALSPIRTLTVGLSIALSPPMAGCHRVAGSPGRSGQGIPPVRNCTVSRQRAGGYLIECATAAATAARRTAATARVVAHNRLNRPSRSRQAAQNARQLLPGDWVAAFRTMAA